MTGAFCTETQHYTPNSKLQRDLTELSRRTFDVVVVGGGVLGAFLCWCASRRGYSVALLESRDFASGTTSASGKVLHGGIRYLQDLKFPLLQEAQAEQEALSHLAPRLVRRLRFLVPPGRDSAASRFVLWGAALTWSGYRAIAGNGLSLDSPTFVTQSGESDLGASLERLHRSAALAYDDIQIRSPERLVIALLRAATADGAVVANYARVTEFLTNGNRVGGVRVLDEVAADRKISVSGRYVVNAAGPWTPELEDRLGSQHLRSTHFAKGTHVVLDRDEPEVALALAVPNSLSGSLAENSGTRRVFVMPWEGKTLVGATYEPFSESLTACRPEHEEISDLLRRIDEHWPGLGLRECRRLHAYSGLYPLFEGSPVSDGTFEASLLPRIIDHEEEDGVSGVASVMSVKLTTARSLAEKVIGIVDRRLRASPQRADSFRDVEPLEHAHPTSVPDTQQVSAELLADSSWTEEFVRRAVNEEMALSLEDLLFRRSLIGHLGQPDEAWLRDASSILGRCLDWSQERIANEVSVARNLFERRL